MKTRIFAVIFSCLGLVACGPGGGETGSTVSTSAALTVQSTSYANKNVAGLTTTALMLKAVFSDEGSDLISTSVTFGDFFQEGKFSAFAVSKTGKAYFFRWQSASSSWLDDSARLFGTGNRYTCNSNATFAISADFNKDSKPDVFLSCSGPTQYLFVSSKTGTSYKLVTPEIALFDPKIALSSNRAAAADVDGDGVLDLILTNSNGDAKPQIWKGELDEAVDGGVKFTNQSTWLSTIPCTVGQSTFTLPNAIDSVFLVPVSNGSVDLVVGGTAPALGGKPYVQMPKKTSPPYYTACGFKGFDQINDPNNPSALKDVFYQDSKFYLVTQSTLTSQIQLTTFTINPDGSPSLPATKRLSESGNGVGKGLPLQYKYNGSGTFQPYDAGCTETRCQTNITPF
jgi:hypothetical protein